MAAANFAAAIFLPQADSDLPFEIAAHIATVVTNVAAVRTQVASVFA
jgi:hypothetical protein